MSGKASFVIGLQYGDEGKGKIVDLMAASCAAVARGNGGSNAGHTIMINNDTKIALHQLPSGVAYNNTMNVIGHGVFLDPVRLQTEIKEAESKGLEITPNNLGISTMCHLVFPIHKVRDAARESGGNGQGTTKAGIAFVASDKALREGIRAEVINQMSQDDLENLALTQLSGSVSDDEAKQLAQEFAASAKAIQSYLQDTISILQKTLDKNENILIEGAQAFGLDINHGKYPYTTSSDTTVPGLLVGTGLNHNHVGTVIGVVKAIPSKVGGGAFVTKINDDAVAESSRGIKGQVDAEYGATTGRQREVGYLDLVALKRSISINGVSSIALTKFDCLMRHGKQTKIATSYTITEPDEEAKTIDIPPTSNEKLTLCNPDYEVFDTWGDISGLTDYNKLPEAAQKYIKFIEEYLGIPVSYIGTGPGRNDIIVRENVT